MWLFRGKPHYPVRGKFRYPPQPPFPPASPIPPPPRTPSRISCWKWRIYAVPEASDGRKTPLNSQAEISKFKADSMSLQDSRFCPFEDNGHCPGTQCLFELHFYICTVIGNMYYGFSFCSFYFICIIRLVHNFFVAIMFKMFYHQLIPRRCFHQLRFHSH